jgi:hypothetical protein
MIRSSITLKNTSLTSIRYKKFLICVIWNLNSKETINSGLNIVLYVLNHIIMIPAILIPCLFIIKEFTNVIDVGIEEISHIYTKY